MSDFRFVVFFQVRLVLKINKIHNSGILLYSEIQPRIQSHFLPCTKWDEHYNYTIITAVTSTTHIVCFIYPSYISALLQNEPQLFFCIVTFFAKTPLWNPVFTLLTSKIWARIWRFAWHLNCITYCFYSSRSCQTCNFCCL